MPQIFRFGPYWVYFWTNESKPLEPIHVHISEGKPAPNATKIWITRTGKCLVCNNNSRIPGRILRNMERMIEARSKEVIEKWYDYFGEISYYC
ncbi:MAG TPA: DUF4160 domain-containing protein [Candidatus Ornithomonoglobus merdipullorum]|uniref:DUF4160 domain-containing protein n=1 Tax=Candidatus Ornithomonoglobus merdipullorum TaxID=2840895 RepID=A0A9D1SFT3_9FIRM|nr:DUF4160 domain-containing protein [Candidatus Ornithomonoglobus merdipullorum]